MSADRTWTEPHTPALSPAQTEERLLLHLAALEFALDPPILINGAQDIQSRKHWSETLDPFEHQVQNLLTFCRRAPVALIADDVGLGKTVSAGLVLSELMTRSKVKRALVLAPSIVLPQWEEELNSKFRIEAAHGTGAELDGLLRGRTPVVITTYETARSRMKRLADIGFDMVIMDEAHTLRNLFGTQKPPELATGIRDALVSRMFRYVLMLTATPIQNRLWDLYSLIELLTKAKGHANPLGTPEQFVTRYVEDRRTARRLVPGRRAEFRQVLGQYMMRARRADCRLSFPQRRVKTFRGDPIPGEIRLNELLAKYIPTANRFAQITIAQALFSSPQALRAQLANMARNGTVPQDLLRHVDAVLATMGRTGKQTVLVEFIRQLASENPTEWRVVVFTGRTETQEALGLMLREEFGDLVGFIRGGQRIANERTIQRFWQTLPSVRILVSGDTGNQGVNLQIANVLVNYDLPWNPMVVEQRIGRVQRLASEHQHVVVSNFVTKGTVEERIVQRLLEKLQLISEAIGDIEGVLEALPGDLEAEGGFEEIIRRLVVDSLMGKDATRAAELAMESIERAKKIYEEEKNTVEENLGKLDALHRAGPSMPKLTPITPSMTPEDFVCRALRAEGATLRPRSQGGFGVEMPGRAPEIVVFRDEDAETEPAGYFARSRTKVYRPGSQHFEQLVGRWSSSAESLICQPKSESDADIDVVVSNWSAGFPGGGQNGWKVLERNRELEGEWVVHASASVAHDKYEKLLRLQPQGVAEGHLASLPDDALRPVDPQAEADFDRAGIAVPVVSAVDRDRDMTTFCYFYGLRRLEEEQRADHDPRLRAEVSQRFTPAMAARIVARRGVLYERVLCEINLVLDGEPGSNCIVEFIPATGQVLREPIRRKCALTDRLLPWPALGRCSVTGTEVVRHKLVRSAEGGKLALPECTVRCDITGDVILADEAVQSSISGKRGRKSLFGASALSGRPALMGELARCELTGDMVLPDELAVSAVSGRRFRGDQKGVGGLASMTGHLSEFVECEATHGWFLPSEIGTSSASGKHVRKDRLVASEKNASRLGLQEETVRCAISGKTLLRDEVERSMVSGEVADRELMKRSEASGSWALPSELLTCEATGKQLLPKETGTCGTTGSLVDRRLLAPSELSGALSLRDRLVPCAATGKRVLPSELVACEITGSRVIPAEIGLCTVTNKRVLRSTLVVSVVSGRLMHQDAARMSAASGKFAAPSELVRCNWDGKEYLPNETAPCALTGVVVSRAHLNINGDLMPLWDMLDGNSPGVPLDEGLRDWAERQTDRRLHGLRAAAYTRSPSGRVAALAGEHRTMLGLRARWIGCLVQTAPERVLLGSIVVGKRENRRWKREP